MSKTYYFEKESESYINDPKEFFSEGLGFYLVRQKDLGIVQLHYYNPDSNYWVTLESVDMIPDDFMDYLSDRAEFGEKGIAFDPQQGINIQGIDPQDVVKIILAAKAGDVSEEAVKALLNG